MVDRVARLADPWQHLVSHSPAVSTSLLFAHVGALVAGGGLALSADRTTMRLRHADEAAREHHLLETAQIHRPIVLALAVSLASGGLLFLADVEVFSASRTFWFKMALTALLLANGLVMARTDASAARAPILWRRRVLSAYASVLLWYTIVLAGCLLASR